MSGAGKVPTTYEEFFKSNPDIRIIIFAGKGGLGKTTFSAATAYHAAKQGKRVLCFSTDPQASLSDIFERDLFGKGETEILPNLFVCEIDADRRIAAYQQEIRQKILDMYGLSEIPKDIDEYIKAVSAEPAMHESATYDAMTEMVARGDYDLYIFDMPPFGHGVRIVGMAELLDAWIDKITEAREKAREYDEVVATLRGTTEAESEDTILGELWDIRRKLDFFSDMLKDKRRTGFFMVLIPEKMAILDTRRALKMFEEYGIALSGIIVNMVYPVELLARKELGSYLGNRIKMQQKYMKQIRKEFGEYLRSVIPMFDREPKGLKMIGKVAEALFGWKELGGS